MSKIFSKYILFLAVVTIFIFISCRKEDDFDESSDIKLAFSTDTLIFDTVFTTIGSTTQILKIYNNHGKSIKISSIKLAGGDYSQFSLNINGVAQNSQYNVELDPDDSLFIFVKVTVDPVSQNSPLIVKDSILFETNGNLQDIDLVAWGQDAHYFIGRSYVEGFRYPYVIVASEGEDITWTNDKPYVIYGYAVVDSSAKLTIEAGTNLHFHKNSGLWVYKYGNLKVNGTAEAPVTFQGDRLEMEYDELPGQWDRIWINEGTDNIINHAIIKNAFIGIQAEKMVDTTGSLVLNNTFIRNMSGYGIFTKFYRIKAGNCMVSDCGKNTLFISTGGHYDFRHCTFADFWNNSVRIEPSVTVSNYIVLDTDGDGIYETTYLGDLQRAYFGNCILYGGLDEEIILAGDDAVSFNYFFDHCLLKTELDISDPAYFSSCYKNEDPLFLNTETNEYHPDTLSFVIDRGSMNIIDASDLNLQNDLEGNSRVADAGPDLGAYEFIPGKYLSWKNRFIKKKKL